MGSISTDKIISVGMGPGFATWLSVLFVSTVSAVLFTGAKKLLSRWCWTEIRGWHIRGWLPETGLEVPPGLGSQTVQLYGWRLYHGSWAENKSQFIFIRAVSGTIKALSAERRDCSSWGVCCLQEAPSSSFVCVPLRNRKRTVWMAVVLQDAYRGLNCHLKSIFPNYILWIWQLIKVSSILMCVTSKNASCRLKSILCWTCGTEVFHSNSSVSFEYVKGLGGIIC